MGTLALVKAMNAKTCYCLQVGSTPCRGSRKRPPILELSPITYVEEVLLRIDDVADPIAPLGHHGPSAQERLHARRLSPSSLRSGLVAFRCAVAQRAH
jgi:hypothetical protein